MRNDKLKRIAVKVGSNVLTRADGGLDVTRMSALVDQLATLHRSGVEVILISSGAVASGRSQLNTSAKLDSVSQRQLFSAIGQVSLINVYYELFRRYGITIGQVLTMKDNFGTRRLYLNQKNCMTVMLDNEVLPVVNENDTVSIEGLMFTDNDELAGLIASMMDVELLVILSSIDGVYNGSPSDPGSEVLRDIEPDADLSSYIQTVKSSFGRGGMLSKTAIARKVAGEGITVVVANGRRDHILLDIVRAEEAHRRGEVTPADLVCTRFSPADVSVSGVKKWIAHSEGFTKGALQLNAQATQILLSERVASLLPIGITAVEGDFEENDLVRILADDGHQLGVGKAECNAAQAREDMGKRGRKPVVHYDYLYIE